MYALEIYVVTAAGVFHYLPEGDQLERQSADDVRSALHRAALEQESILTARAVFVIAAVYGRLAKKCGEARSPRYAHLEAGHAAQSMLLQAVTLGLGSVAMGAFHDQQVQRALSLPAEQLPVYLIAAGVPR